MNVKIDLNKQKISEKVTNDRFGKFVALEWKRLIDQYTPRDTGNLMNNVRYLPFKIHYKSRYAHYMYTGIVYVDPKYHVGGFYNETYGWYSRPGIQKIPSSRSLKYVKNKNPKATDHWDEVAAKAGQKDKLYRTLNSALKNGNY